MLRSFGAQDAGPSPRSRFVTSSLRLRETVTASVRRREENAASILRKHQIRQSADRAARSRTDGGCTALLKLTDTFFFFRRGEFVFFAATRSK